jgi:hypothetical protein
MRLFLAIYFLLVLPIFIGRAKDPAIQTEKPCVEGIDRWSVKTMTDSLAKKVRLTPIKSSILEMRSFKPGRKIGGKTPRFGEEFKTYEIVCRITEYIREADGDFHLVLADTLYPDSTIVGEIPDPLCPSVQKSTQINKITTSRVYFVENVKEKAGRTKPGIYRVKGIAFFDKVHGQKGGAKNGIEIHPILSIKKLK